MSILFSFIVFAAFAFFAYRRLLQYLHIFQQEEYKASPFLFWIVETRSFDKRVSLTLLALFLILSGLYALIPAGAVDLLVAAVFAFFSRIENDPRKVAKKKLVLTSRAKRIFGIAFGFCLIAGIAIVWTKASLFWILAVQFVPLSLALANGLLIPLEAHIQKKILADAASILTQVNPKTIGITGSFGKTSVKHILGHILEVDAPTLYTPGSINTLMGISRIIRENLNSQIRYFLVEMGAYGRGSIEKLCRLTPPQIGIITALGEAHYERFKTLDSIAHAKFELAESVLSRGDGKMIVHEDVLAQEYARNFVEKHREAFLICGRRSDADCVIGKIDQTTSGLTVSVQWQKQEFSLFAPLFGAAHANNMTVAFASALACGVAPERACAALRTVPQIQHRLQVVPESNGTIYIDDAYNSNPRGFEAALDLLAALGAEKKARRILITPGIVELGEKNDEIHRALGIKAAQNADVVIVVRSDKIPAFAEGFRSCAKDKQIHLVASFKEARAWLEKNAKPSDILLFENDLPDVDEAKLAL
ncbi:MAG: Mur ligase family protein [Bdellovibrionales bacterium]|jgi:UDP-N-acetylmuramoyl-tripeptide--D-alanyl-D-alanine ligase